MERYHPNVSTDLLIEINKPSFEIASMAIGETIILNLDEGVNLEKSLQLEATLKEYKEGKAPVFEITDGIVPAEIIESNRKYKLKNPEMVGEEWIVHGGCTWRKGYMPPMTMLHIGYIDIDRHLYSGFDTADGKGLIYTPVVRSYALKG